MPQQHGVTFSNPFLHRAVDVFDSLEQSLEPSTTVVPKTHFVEWFSGSALDSIWTIINLNGSGGSSGMSDTIDGGFFLTTQTTAAHLKAITCNDIKHYAHDSSVFIGIIKTTSTAGQTAFTGCVADDAFSNSFALIGQDTGQSTTDFVIRTDDGSAESSTAATFALDTIFHNHKVELTSSNNLYTIDGGLEVTKTSNRPTTSLQPLGEVQRLSGGARTAHIRYLEAYST